VDELAMSDRRMGRWYRVNASQSLPPLERGLWGGWLPWVTEALRRRG
jgi:hypothetical protein